MSSDYSSGRVKRLKAPIYRNVEVPAINNNQAPIHINNNLSGLKTPKYVAEVPHPIYNQIPSAYEQKMRLRSLQPYTANLSSRSQQAPQMALLQSAIAQTPAIPGKNQRILVNKVRGVSASKSASRIYKRPKLVKTVVVDSSESCEVYSSFIQAAKPSTAASNKSFNTTTKRFDRKMDMKEFFNREAGPGTYSVSTAESSQMGSMSVNNMQGFGNGFASKTERFKETTMDQQKDPYIHVGPGYYDPQKLEKHVAVPKLQGHNNFSLPFNERNPLNYVKPITVNIYFKQDTPGVGTYDPQKIMKNAPVCTSMFQSQVPKIINDYQLKKAQFQPGPASYDNSFGFDLVERQKDVGTQQFRHPVPKKIVPVNLYNPHADIDEDSKQSPGPGKYNIPSQFDKLDQEQLQSNVIGYNGGRIYAENNLDRFGQPILPRKPMDGVPGPGEYNVSTNPDQDFVIAKGGFIPQSNDRSLLNQKEKGVPGPAFYNVANEPKKISFLFNANEKWIN